MLDSAQKQQFEEQGFLVVRGLLDPKAELAALDAAYQDLIETLAAIHFAEAGGELPRDFRALPLGERFALMQGASGGHAVEHLDPQLNAFQGEHRRRSDHPSAQIPQLFRLLRSAPLLDAVEALIGPEIAMSPNYHLNFKLAAPQLALVRETARRLGHPDPSQRPYHAFHLAQTPWHRDATYALPDSWDSRIVAAWVPMTQAGGERGTLSVIPGSQRDRRPPTASQRELSEAGVALAASPGDVVFFDNWLLHGSTPNQSAADVRWAFNFRYLPRGQPAGRPYLPTCVLRSRSQPQRELHNPVLWSEIWRRALDHLARPASPAPQHTSLARAQAITREWQQRVPDEAAWLRLAPAPLPAWRSALRRFRRRLKRARRRTRG